MCVPSFDLLGLTVPAKRMIDKFQCWKLERKKNEEIKWWISSSSLILVYMTHLPTVHVCTNFQSSRPHSFEKSATKNFHVENWERKKNEEIKERISSSSLILINMIHLPTFHLCIEFQSSRPHSSREKCDKNFLLKIGDKEKWRNNEMNKKQQPDSSKHGTSAHCPRVYQFSIF